MKRSEIISKYRKEIATAMVEHYRSVIECDGRIQYKIYIWEDGELEYLYGVQGDHGWLQPRSMEPRELYYVGMVDAPFFNPWDYTDHSAPDDEAERESEREEILDWCVQEYQNSVYDVLDAIIDEAE